VLDSLEEQYSDNVVVLRAANATLISKVTQLQEDLAKQGTHLEQIRSCLMTLMRTTGSVVNEPFWKVPRSCFGAAPSSLSLFV
jgi:hypothetical protein